MKTNRINKRRQDAETHIIIPYVRSLSPDYDEGIVQLLDDKRFVYWPKSKLGARRAFAYLHPQ
jgi:hypothetical protein